MNRYFEFFANGSWRPLHAMTWEEAKLKANEFGYKIRIVRLYWIEEEYDPNEKKKE